MGMARVDIRLDDRVKSRAERASALLGLKSLTEFIVRIMDEKSTEVLSEHERMTLPEDEFDRFTAACEQAEAPNKQLTEAFERLRKSSAR